MGARERASRNALLAVSDLRFASFWPRTGAPRRCQTSLGYEPYDARLWRLWPSSVSPLASASLRREAVSDLLCLLRLSLSRRVPCTIPCTNLVSDLLAVIPGTAGRVATAADSAVPRRMPQARWPSQTV
jgi:hypothetical protein